MGAGRDGLFEVGVVAGTHGLRGDLRVRPFTADSASLLAAREVFFRLADGEVVSHVPVRAVMHKGNVLLRLEGLESIEAVRPLLGSSVLMDFADLEELSEEEYYWFELEGLTVIDGTRGELGTLIDVFSTAAHDVYVVRGPFGEVLIPAVAEFIREIDREGGWLKVDLPEGLVPKPDEV